MANVNDEPSDVAVRVEYVYQILTNFLNLLSDEDREFLTRYWGGMLQITEDMYLQLYQNDLSKNINTVPVFRRSKWNEIIFTTGVTRAQIPSTIVSSTFDTSIATGDNTITIIVDGNPFQVTFTDSATNAVQNVIDEINVQASAALPGLSLDIASLIDNRMALSSIDAGDNSSISIDSSDGNAILGFYAGVSATGSGYSSRSEPAQLIGSNPSAIMDTSIANGTNSFRVNANENGIVIVALPNDATTTIIEVINTINTYIPNFASMSADNRLVLTSSISGRDSSIVIPTGGGNSELGFVDTQFSLGSGTDYNNPIPNRPISYEVAIGTANDNLELVVLQDPAIVSIPALRSRIDGPTLVFGQGDSPHLGTEEMEPNFGTSIDPGATLVSDAYIIRDNRIHFSKAIEAQWVNAELQSMWAEDVYRNDTYLKDNFGFPIQLERDNSIVYKNVLQGLHHSYWTGPIKKRTEVGLNLLFDLPTSPVDGKIESIVTLSSPELIGIEASDTFDVSGANRTFSFTIDGTFIFVVFAASQPLAVQQNYPAASVIADINAAAIPVLGFPTASAYVPDPSQPTIVQIKLTGLQSIRIDTVTGNAGIGFPPGELSFGETQITIGGFEFDVSTEFPITKQVGDIVAKLDPLTDGVEVLHYISDPIWWEVFGLSTLDSKFNLAAGYTQADLDMINELLKYHIFGVKIVPDAFTRIQPLEVSIVSKFINDIRAITKNFIFLIPFMLLDVFTLTDDSNYDGLADISKAYTLVYPPTLDNPFRNLIGTAENPGIHPDSTSFSAANFGITEYNFADGTHTGDISGFCLDVYDVHMHNNGTADVIQGIGPNSYVPAIILGTNPGPFDTTYFSGNPFTITVNGTIVIVLGGTHFDEIPIGTTVQASEVALAISNKIASVAPPLGPGSVAFTPGQLLHFRADRFDTVTPIIIMNQAYPSLGIPVIPGTILGQGGTLLQTVNF